MADIISCFPDSILCYILSFLPTKQVVVTSVLSRRWNLLWRSVPSFDFDFDSKHFSFDDEEKEASRLLLSMNSFLRGRDMDQPLHILRLGCYFFYDHNAIHTCIHDLLRSGTLEHLHLQMDWSIPVPSLVFTCKTLVVLKLVYIRVENNSLVDLPLLKILHLEFISVLHCPDLLQQFLSGCLNLEDLKVNIIDYCTMEEFQTLPKLVRAEIDTCVVPLEIVKNVQVLVTCRIYEQDLVFDLQNLVQLEFVTLEFSEGWLDVLKVFRHCPKLQTLVIRIEVDEEEEAVLPYPHTVSTCISLHLKTCCVKDYRGSAFEFQFAEYIMLNANCLRTMKFLVNSYEYDDLLRRHDMIRDLSSCSKSSDTCTLSFEKSVNF